MNINVLTHDDLIWPMGRQDNVPEYRLGCGSYPRTQKVDAYPCYTPDVELVTRMANECEEKFPLTGAVTAYYLLPHEVIDRFNGCTFVDYIYRDSEGNDTKRQITCYCGCGKVYDIDQLATFVVLSGKRIPLHPAMLRYLVAHEYGHMVFNHLCGKRGYRDSDSEALQQKYMEVRGITKNEYTTTYSGAKWHLNPGEIFANDFRVLIMGREQEFWPHPFPAPSLDMPRLLEWWDESCNLCSVPFNPVL